jgi:Zn-dependent peptidase ImmA (M78 family)
MPQANEHHANESVLRTLRDLVPQRRLSCSESLRIAELQANRLLELFKVRGPQVPSQLITELPRIEVRYEHDLPVSGSAHWEAGQWVITLNASEPHARRRFSLMHEFKHVLDHTTKLYLYGNPEIDERAIERAERAADTFAAALLMPKRWIKARWYESDQSLVVLADRIGVSTRALSVRLYHLGIDQATARCPRTSRPRSDMRRYLRYTPQSAGAAR